MLAFLAQGDHWTGIATTFVAAGAIVASGLLVLYSRVDQTRLDRKRVWEEYNRTSLEVKLQQAEEALAAQRKAAEEMRVMAQAAGLENHHLHEDLATLRQQFLEAATALRSAEADLHAAHAALRSASAGD